MNQSLHHVWDLVGAFVWRYTTSVMQGIVIVQIGLAAQAKIAVDEKAAHTGQGASVSLIEAQMQSILPCHGGGILYKAGVALEHYFDQSQ